jgi:hypothetical protein
MVEAKWTSLCAELEVEPHLSVHEIKGVMHADKATSAESFWAANWEALCGFLELDPSDSYGKNEKIIGGMKERASHFSNLVSTLQPTPDAETAGGIMNLIKKREYDAVYARKGTEPEWAVKWEKLSTAFGVGTGESPEYLAKSIKAKHPEDFFVGELRSALGCPPQYTWIGVMGEARRMRREYDEYLKNVEGLRDLTARHKVEADKWRGICQRYGVEYTAELATLGTRIEYHEFKRHADEKWNKLCAHFKFDPIVSTKAFTDLLPLKQDMLQVFWTKLTAAVCIPGLTGTAPMNEANMDAIISCLTEMRANAGGWVNVCSVVGMRPNTNYPSVIAKLQQGKDRWLDLCKHVGIAPDVSMEAVLKQILEMYDLAPPKNMAEFFRIQMPMVLDGKTRTATLVVSTQISDG